MFRRIAKILATVFAGYTTMFLGILIVQEGIFGGVVYQTTPLPQLLVAGALTAASAVAGGVVAAVCFGRPFYPPALIICGLVVLETSYMIGSGRLPGPVWFDVMAACSLLVGILLGVFAVKRWRSKDSNSDNVPFNAVSS